MNLASEITFYVLFSKLYKQKFGMRKEKIYFFAILGPIPFLLFSQFHVTSVDPPPPPFAGVAEYLLDLNIISLNEMSNLIHQQIIIIRPTIYQFSVHVPKMGTLVSQGYDIYDKLLLQNMFYIWFYTYITRNITYVHTYIHHEEHNITYVRTYITRNIAYVHTYIHHEKHNITYVRTYITRNIAYVHTYIHHEEHNITYVRTYITRNIT